jgi:hypothetical protein
MHPHRKLKSLMPIYFSGTNWADDVGIRRSWPEPIKGFDQPASY